MQFTSFIIQVLEDASEIARKNFGKTSSVLTKAGDNNQVLTETDLEIGKLIVSKIQDAYPTHSIIDEEAGVIDKNSEYVWVVDPIDGTSNFANGIPLYGTMFGLLKSDTPIAGGVSLPSLGEVYVAEQGDGAYYNGARIFASTEKELLKTLVAYGIDGHQENPQMTYDEINALAEIILNVRNLRSSNSVFDLMQVAKGSYGGVLNKTSKIWDNVAPHIILEESGCIYTDFFGQPIDYKDSAQKTASNFTFCAAPPLLHNRLQEIIHNL